MDLERFNHRQIEQLNQRGGRTLTVVDLIRAGTISVDMAACACRAIAEGASLLTGARPGGAGKTTLMASLLHLLSPDVPIVTVDSPEVLYEDEASAIDQPACYLVHEIGAGHWYAYLWGPDVARYVGLSQGRRRIASCLHADTLEELKDILCSAPLGVEQEALGRVELILFMYVGRTTASYQRRVSTYWEADGNGGHRLLFQWRPDSDRFHQTDDIRDPTGLERYVEFLQRLVEEGEIDARSMRRKVLRFYESGD
jgi:hypothetical protein